jgi:hypothetical protein
MVESERGRDERENETNNATPRSGDDQAKKSKGMGDGALEKASFGGRTEADALNDAHKEATQGRPDDGGSTEDNPYEHG